MSNENKENRFSAKSQLRTRESSELSELGELCKAVADPTPQRAKEIIAAKTKQIIVSDDPNDVRNK